MRSEIQNLHAELKLIEWRNAEFAKTTEQLETAFPKLVNDIVDYVDALPKYKTALVHASLVKRADALIEPWANAEFEKAKNRAEETLVDVLSTIPAEAKTYDHITSGLFFSAAPILTIASLASIPTLISFATITTMFGLGSTIVVPTLVIGTGGLVVANVIGWKALDQLNKRAQQKLASRMIAHARKVVFGTGLPSDAPYLLNNMQALILKASQQTVGEQS